VLVTQARRLGTHLALATALAGALACGHAGPRAAAERPLPDTLPVYRAAALDSALALIGITVEYHWEAPDTLVPGLAVASYPHPATGFEVRLVDSVAFDLTGVVTALAQTAEPGWWVTLRTNTAGGEQLLRTTTRHQGERIGVLVNGYLVTLATVNSPLTDMLPVTDIVPPDQAEVLAERINRRLGAWAARPRRGAGSSGGADDDMRQERQNYEGRRGIDSPATARDQVNGLPTGFAPPFWRFATVASCSTSWPARAHPSCPPGCRGAERPADGRRGRDYRAGFPSGGPAVQGRDLRRPDSPASGTCLSV